MKPVSVHFEVFVDFTAAAAATSQDSSTSNNQDKDAWMDSIKKTTLDC